MFKIISCGYNVEQYLEKCIQSVMTQTSQDWQMYIVLDPCTDRSHEIATRFASDKITVINNTERFYALKNICIAIEASKASPDDILVLLDADDFLSSNKALEIIESYYSKHAACLLTYGTMYYLSSGKNDETTAYRFFENFRTYKWKIRHLRTLKHKLWRAIPHHYLLDSKGCYYTISSDIAIMIPALELAGHRRIRQVKEVVYGYNDLNVLNDFRQAPDYQKTIEAEIRAKKPLRRLRKFE
ncbi:MAG: glycosyltransferase family 2 protein [Chitinivibrionales bacterium]|nr:glycosyltransferase family 2 protein [Chitinivibrionales bacterium]